MQVIKNNTGEGMSTKNHIDIFTPHLLHAGQVIANVFMKI
jgi:hypothetical protein